MDLQVAAITLPFVFAFGACIGSFLNVVVYRLPAGLSLLYPPSRCPHCHHRLGNTENVPVLGWIRLHGRCRWCRAPISVRYPLVEAATGLIFCWVFWVFGLSLVTLGYWVLVSWLFALALIDWDTMTLPNVLTKSCLLLGLAFQVLQGWTEGKIPNTLMGGIGSAVLGIWLFDLIRWTGTIVLGQPAMGGGDPKLAAAIGAWLGWQKLLVTGFLACSVGAIVGGAAIALGLLGRRHPFPFGPFLVLGAILTIFWGDSLLSLYQDLFFPSF